MPDPVDPFIEAALSAARPLLRQAIDDWLEAHADELASLLEAAVLRSLEDTLRKGLSKAPLGILSQLLRRP